MKYKNLLFDLDGTITDSTEGIVNSIKYALSKLDFSDYDENVLKKFIGPPLTDSYKKYFGMNDKEASDGLFFFREYFEKRGMYENRLYPKTDDLLKSLNEYGYKIFLATSKPKLYAEKILKYFDIHKYFYCVCGCPMKEDGITKTDIIKSALMHAKAENLSDSVMIGDTKYDILGAKNCQIDSIAVLYGIGEEYELCDATYKVKSVSDLKKLLI